MATENRPDGRGGVVRSSQIAYIPENTTIYRIFATPKIDTNEFTFKTEKVAEFIPYKAEYFVTGSRSYITGNIEIKEPENIIYWFLMVHLRMNLLKVKQDMDISIAQLRIKSTIDFHILQERMKRLIKEN